MRLTDTDIDVRIGARIRALRAKRNLTLDGLACRADVSRAMLSRIERGESSPTAQLLNKVCGGLGITLSEFFAEAILEADAWFGQIPLERRMVLLREVQVRSVATGAAPLQRRRSAQRAMGACWHQRVALGLCLLGAEHIDRDTCAQLRCRLAGHGD